MESSEPMWSWRSSEVETGIRIRFAIAGSGPATALLIHGYPETALAWRKVVRPLVEAGYRVIAPDLRGAGGSARPIHGYDKATLADDCLQILNSLDIREPILVVGHDIGLMVAYAFARRHGKRTRGLVAIDAPLPGTAAFDKVSLDDTRVWHFHFHQAQDIPEALTSGREALYLERFWHDLAYDAGAIETDVKAEYLASFTGPGGMRAGFELYRAFNTDAETNRYELAHEGRLKIPVLAISGESSAFAPIMKDMMKEVAEQVLFEVIPRSGHWIAEENPTDLVKALITFDSEISPVF